MRQDIVPLDCRGVNEKDIKMPKNLSLTRFSIYTYNPKFRKKIVKDLRPNLQKGSGGDYYIQLTSRIKKYEEMRKISKLPFEMNKITSSRIDKQKKPFLQKCANGYLNVRSDYDISHVTFPENSVILKKGFNLKSASHQIWHLADKRKVFVGYYLDRMDMENPLSADKAKLMSAVIAQNEDFEENNVFLIIDLANGKCFGIADDGARLLPEINKQCSNISKDLEG